MERVRHRFLALLLLAGCATPAKPTSTPEHPLLEAMQSSDPAMRDRAQRDLTNLGLAALPILDQAERHPDAEVRVRCRAVRAEVAWFLPPVDPDILTPEDFTALISGGSRGARVIDSLKRKLPIPGAPPRADTPHEDALALQKLFQRAMRLGDKVVRNALARVALSQLFFRFDADDLRTITDVLEAESNRPTELRSLALMNTLMGDVPPLVRFGESAIRAVIVDASRSPTVALRTFAAQVAVLRDSDVADFSLAFIEEEIARAHPDAGILTALCRSAATLAKTPDLSKWETFLRRSSPKPLRRPLVQYLARPGVNVSKGIVDLLTSEFESGHDFDDRFDKDVAVLLVRQRVPAAIEAICDAILIDDDREEDAIELWEHLKGTLTARCGRRKPTLRPDDEFETRVLEEGTTIDDRLGRVTVLSGKRAMDRVVIADRFAFGWNSLCEVDNGGAAVLAMCNGEHTGAEIEALCTRTAEERDALYYAFFYHRISWKGGPADPVLKTFEEIAAKTKAAPAIPTPRRLFK